jgi:hypothetical protein
MGLKNYLSNLLFISNNQTNRDSCLLRVVSPHIVLVVASPPASPRETYPSEIYPREKYWDTALTTTSDFKFKVLASQGLT